MLTSVLRNKRNAKTRFALKGVRTVYYVAMDEVIVSSPLIFQLKNKEEKGNKQLTYFRLLATKFYLCK